MLRFTYKHKKQHSTPFNPEMPMEKSSTLTHSANTANIAPVMQPRRSTIARLRQMARAAYAAPVGPVLIMN